MARVVGLPWIAPRTQAPTSRILRRAWVAASRSVALLPLVAPASVPAAVWPPVAVAANRQTARAEARRAEPHRAVRAARHRSKAARPVVTLKAAQRVTQVAELVATAVDVGVC